MTKDANTAHPASTFETEYPYNQATITRGGHEFHINDAPGKESIRIAHTAGTYWEIDRDGRLVQSVVGKRYEYNADNVATTTDGHSDSKVSGSGRSVTGGGTLSETGGNVYSGAGGIEISGTSGSKIDSSTGGDGFQTTAGNVVTEHEGDVNHSVVGGMVTQVTEDRADIIGKDYAVSVQEGSMDVQATEGKIRLKAAQDIIIDSDSKIRLQVGDSYIEMTANKIVLYTPGQMVVAAKGEAGVYSKDSFVTVSGKRNRIRSAQGTILEPASVPPAGQIQAPK